MKVKGLGKGEGRGMVESVGDNKETTEGPDRLRRRQTSNPH